MFSVYLGIAIYIQSIYYIYMAIGACIGQFFLIILGPGMINGWLAYTLEWQEVQEIESILYGK